MIVPTVPTPKMSSGTGSFVFALRWALRKISFEPPLAIASSRATAKDAPVNGQFLVLTVELMLDGTPWLGAAPLIVGRGTL